MSGDNRICAQCIQEPFLQKIIVEQNIHQPCNYCGEEQPTISISELAERCDNVIENFYECVGDDFWENQLRPGDTLQDVLAEELELNSDGDQYEQILNDLVDELGERWFDYSSHQSTYSDDDLFRPVQSMSDQLRREWHDMARTLQQQNRFFNSNVEAVLDKIFGPLSDYQTKNGSPLIIEYAANEKSFYRGRVFQSTEALEKALKSPESHLGPPPANAAASGRMNASGISVFYGATEKINAIAEVRPPVGSYVALAEFELIKPVRLLNISEFEHISPTRNSHFDPEMVRESSRCQFLNQLVRQLTMPVMPEKQNQDYLVTQVVADYLSQPRFNLDGILFPSAQNAKADKTDAQNIILFNRSSSVMVITANRDASLWEWDDIHEGYRLSPHIVTRQAELDSHKPFPDWEPESSATLQLNMSTIEIHDIRAVAYETKVYPVEHIVRNA